MEKKRRKVIILISIIITAILITIGISVKASGNTEIAKSVTFTENMEGTYVYVRAVDAAGNKGAWSEAQRVWIDNTSPTVTAKKSSVTIEEGDVNNLEDYFTVVANGSNSDINVVWTIDGVEYTTTEALTAAGSPYTVTCTASKNGGASNSATMTLVVEPGWKIAVTAKQATLDTTIMESNTFDSLFTVVTNDGGTATKTYTLNGETTSYSNTNELSAGTYTLNCTATYGGETASASVNVTMAKNWVNIHYTENEITIPERCECC